MKTLTISQPFASLIAFGEKFVENRTWATRYRGPIAIHAGKGTQYLTRKELEDYPNGGIIAVAELVACISIDRIKILGGGLSMEMKSDARKYTWRELKEHRHTEGPVCWVLEGVRECEFFPCKGAQGLWTFAGELKIPEHTRNS